MLDCRYYRTSPKLPPNERSMLGPVQKAWLKETLKNSNAKVRVIASSVPISQGVKPGSPDPWDGYAVEREEIFSFLESENIQSVLFIAADRHRSDIWRTDRPSGRSFYEFQSSRLTNLHTHAVMKGSIFGYRDEPSFGKLTFDTQSKPPLVTYSIVNINNETVFEWGLREELGIRN
jgi:alkaline phosphatase D